MRELSERVYAPPDVSLVIAELFVVAGAQLAIAYRKTNVFIDAHAEGTPRD